MIKTCDKPDRDAPKLICGYPLPCPFHTVIIEKNKTIVPHRVNTRPVRQAVKQIKRALFKP